MKKSTLLLITGLCLVIVGGALAFGPFMDYLRGRSAVTKLQAPFSSVVHAETPSKEPGSLISGKPIRLHIPSIGIDLAVKDGKFNAQAKTWTLSKNYAHYAVNTPLANNSEGNTFIYGHNRKGVLRTLNRIEKGSQAIVTTDNGHRFVYIFTAAYETNPDDDSLFSYKGAPILTVQTCSGLRFEHRQLFTFTFDRVE